MPAASRKPPVLSTCMAVGTRSCAAALAAVLNGKRSIAIDCVDVDTVSCSGVQERIGGSSLPEIARQPRCCKGSR